jgi:hypothetical protein
LSCLPKLFAQRPIEAPLGYHLRDTCATPARHLRDLRDLRDTCQSICNQQLARHPAVSPAMVIAAMVIAALKQCQ